MITLKRYVLVQQLTQGLAGMAPEWPEADPALNRFVLADDATREIERLEVDLKELQGRYDQTRLLYDGADKSAREAIEERDRLRDELGSLANQVIDTLPPILESVIAALDYYVFHRTAGMDALIYEAHNDMSPEHTMQAIKRRTVEALAALLRARQEIFKMPSKLNGLHPDLQIRAHAFMSIAEMQKCPFIVTQGYRSIEEQDALYAKGRTAPGAIVTKAKGGSSWHNYGLAFDIVPVDPTGQPIWTDSAPQWRQLGELGEHCGLEWGGRWQFRDLPHFQLIGGLSIGEASIMGITKLWEHIDAKYRA